MARTRWRSSISLGRSGRKSMQGARRSVRPGAKVHRRGEPKLGSRGGAPRRRPQRKRRKASRLNRALARHPLFYKGIRLSLLSLIWGTILLGLTVIYFLARVPDPIVATLDDRPPNVTVLASDGT